MNHLPPASKGHYHIEKVHDRAGGSAADAAVRTPPSKTPNFAPRRAHPGGKMATNDKDEVQVKFNLRKNVPIEEWPERLKRKKAEMDRLGKREKPAADDEPGGGDESDDDDGEAAADGEPKKKGRRRSKGANKQRTSRGDRQRDARRNERTAATDGS